MKQRKKWGGMIKSDGKNSYVSNLVDRYDEKALISSLSNPSASLLAPNFKLFIAVFCSHFATR